MMIEVLYTDTKSANIAQSVDPYTDIPLKVSVIMSPDLIRFIYNYTGKAADKQLTHTLPPTYAHKEID
jgi:hypothetical protein